MAPAPISTLDMARKLLDYAFSTDADITQLEFVAESNDPKWRPRLFRRPTGTRS